jgi:ketosteroid isomerase-like protein
MNFDELTSKVECEQLLARLCLALDRGDNAQAADFFTEDAVLIMPNGEAVGPAVRKVLEGRSATVFTRHILTNTVISQTSAEAADAQAYLTVYRVSGKADDVLPRRLPATPQTLGDWKIQLRKAATGWKISRYEAAEVLAPAN